ncbi:hypothetical protein MAM1_0082d04594 [Mucor ambiguus]|uniref:HNH domain-containing protein n=1 Tax=Mucor ambiguus TaxID=91626 RepID=A0A0C9LUJ3_9FUNG|nr:hypothetical protein MAM1_0082d04594 [Mucor ambiguus]
MPREKKPVSMPSKKSNVIYENWRVYSRHHKLMFRCNEKKARWYLEKELATLLPKEERAIRLNFETKGDGHKHGDYMVEDRSNICVSCGGNEYLTMHHVGKLKQTQLHWMPLVVKSKSSRDLLLLCKHCHDDYEQKAMNFKKAGVKRFNIPLEGSGWCTFPEYKNAKKAASALIRSSDKIPQKRQQVLKSTVLDFWKDYDKKEYKGDELDDILKECSELVDHFKGPDYLEHGQSAIQQLTNKCVLNDKGQETWPDLEVFIREWRQHFLDNLKPKHLSKLWSVDADIYTR